MKTFIRKRTFLSCLALAASLTTAYAQTWPQAKAITLVVGYPAGLGGQIIVENVGGAGGTIGAQKVVTAEPDGYTLLLGSGSEVSIARIYNAAVKYNGETDLTPLGLIGVTPMVFVAGAKAGVKTMP